MATGAQIEGSLVTDCPHHCGKVPKPKVAWGNDSFTVTGKYYPIKNTSDGAQSITPIILTDNLSSNPCFGNKS